MPLSARDEQARDRKEKLELSTAEIGLTVRTTNCLEERGIFTVRELLQTTRSELLSISNFGEKTLEEVYLALEKIGFCRDGVTPAEPAAGQEHWTRSQELEPNA
jgi:DNA-directed RNA polymerase subunit alpha